MQLFYNYTYVCIYASTLQNRSSCSITSHVHVSLKMLLYKDKAYEGKSFQMQQHCQFLQEQNLHNKQNKKICDKQNNPC